MESAASPNSGSSPPPKSVPVVDCWPRSAQLTVAFLLGCVTVLGGMHLLGMTRWQTRPTALKVPDPAAYRVDLNRASRAELLQLPGMGESLAGRVEDYRRAHQGFRDVDELEEIYGVGPATVERLRPWVSVEGERRSGEGNVDKRHSTPKSAAKKGPGSTAKKKAPVKPVDINRATIAELQTLPGIGPKMAERIAEERLKKPFESPADLRRVRGIGPKTLDRVLPFITIGADANSVVSAFPD